MKLIEPSMLDLLNLCYNARSDEVEQYKALIGPWNYEEVAIGFYNKPGIKFGIVGDDSIVV